MGRTRGEGCEHPSLHDQADMQYMKVMGGYDFPGSYV